MTGDIRDVARLGLVHHMLYPECTTDAQAHAATLMQFVQRGDIETFDCCLPYGDDLQAPLIEAIRTCGKTNVTFATHLFPLRKIGFASTLPGERGQTRLIVDDMIRQAVAIGANGFIFASGAPSPDDASPVHYDAFESFCFWLCSRLAEHGITALLEPFDTSVDKCFLYGPTASCMNLLEGLAERGIKNLGIELDLAHVPLMGETFAQAIRTTAPKLRRAHLGNCVLADTESPLYGDKHPPIGIDGGEIDIPELVVILRELLEVGYLDKDSRGDLVLEMTPWPGRSTEWTVEDAVRRVERAWGEV